ncbi:MAG: tRNA (adenosine(37)-N6)-threonylcarbamoyltransferase complex dimerization subunit type 1 TsaB [Nitrospirota bacterium]
MKILAIETSTMLGGVAIIDDLSGLIAEVRLNVKSTHSERLMIEVDHILKQAGLRVSDVDVFAVAIGPGSFTGLRIGLSTAKGFSYATGKPIVSVPTLEALAWNFPYCRYPVCTMLDARKKEVYSALFKWDNKCFIRLIDEVSIKVDGLLEKINENNPPLPPFTKGGQGGDYSKGEVGLSDKRVVFTGDGALLYRDKIIEVMGENAIFASPEKMVPSPANVAYLGIKKAMKGEFSEPVSLIPFYIRKSEAEIKRDA